MIWNMWEVLFDVGEIAPLIRLQDCILIVTLK